MRALLACVPALPYFCANIHVGCAGRSRIVPRAFRVERSAGGVRILFADGSQSALSAADSAAGTILTQPGVPGYIRLAPDGSYSQRIYRGGGALMMRGTCAAP